MRLYRSSLQHGGEKWVFNDSLRQPLFKEWIGKVVGKEGEDATRHDKWCCMIYPRLQLLRDLLSDDGVLFASIDDNEMHSLRAILDETFRVDKPLATLVWKRRSPTGMRRDPVSVDHEYVFLYAKDTGKVQLSGLVRTEADYPYEDAGGVFASTDLTIGMTCEDRPNQCYTIENPRTHAKYPPNQDRVWRFEPEAMERVIADRLVIWPDESPGEMTRPRYKTYFDPDKPKIRPLSSWIESGSSLSAEAKGEAEDLDLTVLTSGMNTEGGRALSRIMGRKVFDYPKPVSLIKSLVRAATKGDDIVLDSFAGSGTTGQAVLEQNASDGHSRRFILIQIPYDSLEHVDGGFNVCREVTAERVKRIIRGYSYAKRAGASGKRERVTGLGDSFSYFKLGEPLLGEYRELGDNMPPYEELAKYIFYTETSRDFDPRRIYAKTGKIGEYKGTSYYLLYTTAPNESRALDTKWLKALGEGEKNRSLVIYCEKLWVHRDDMAKYQNDTGRKIRAMVLPFNLK